MHACAERQSRIKFYRNVAACRLIFNPFGNDYDIAYIKRLVTVTCTSETSETVAYTLHEAGSMGEETLANWSDGLGARQTLDEFVTDITGLQIGENKHVGAACDKAAGRF